MPHGCHLSQKQFDQQLLNLVSRTFDELVQALQNKDRTVYETLTTAINAALVWTKARSAASPYWEYCNRDKINRLITLLNRFTPSDDDQLVILTQPHVWQSSKEVHSDIVLTCRNSPKVQFTTDLPIDNGQFGYELDMYSSNVRMFVKGMSQPDAFVIQLNGLKHLQLYAEMFSKSSLSKVENGKFVKLCKKRCKKWNMALKKLNLLYEAVGKIVLLSKTSANEEKLMIINEN